MLWGTHINLFLIEDWIKLEGYTTNNDQEEPEEEQGASVCESGALFLLNFQLSDFGSELLTGLEEVPEELRLSQHLKQHCGANGDGILYGAPLTLDRLIPASVSEDRHQWWWHLVAHLGCCSQATEPSSGKQGVCLLQLTQAWPLGLWISLRVCFLTELPCIHVDLWLGSRRGTGRLRVEVERGCSGGCQEAPFSLVCIRLGLWAGQSCVEEQGVGFHQTVSLLQCRLVIGALRQFSVVFVNKVFSTRGMKMRFWGLWRAVSSGHFICPGTSAELGGSYLPCPQPCWQIIPPASEWDSVILIGHR